MKIKYLALTIFVLLGSGCDRFLDEVPDSRIEVDTPEKIRRLLVSAYTESYPSLVFELGTDNYTDLGTAYSNSYDIIQETYLYKDASVITRSSPHWVWENTYKAVATANLALESIEALENPEEASAQKGEALLCRAFGHYILVNTFSQAYNTVSSSTDLGIPYSTVSETNVKEHYERGTVAEVYKKIVEDIEEGIPLLDDSSYSVPAYHFNKRAANAFAAEVYLYLGEYDKAIEYADKVLGNDASSVLRDYTPIGNAAASADVKYIFNDVEEPANLLIIGSNCIMGRVANGNSSSYRRYVHGQRIQTNGTYRSPGPWGTGTALSGFKSWVRDNVHYYNGLIGEIFQYTDEATNTGYPYTFQPVFSTDRLCLVRAEAYILTGQYDLAARDLTAWINGKTLSSNTYTVQSFVDYYSTASEEWIRQPLEPRGFTIEEGTQLDMIYAVLHARRIEGLNQGWRWIDIKRYGMTVTHYVYNDTDQVLAPWDNRKAIQIPGLVIAAGLEANPR